MNKGNKVAAILTLGRDITPYADPIYLFSLYKKRYPIRQAISQFLKHLKIDSCFQEMPTNQELIALLTMRKNSVSKYVAKALNVGYKTIEEYKARIRKKLKIVSLDELLIMLRVRHEYTDLCW